jgi:hypothetical protein
LLGLGVIALVLVFAPTAAAGLDPTDTATGTGALASENGGFANTADGYFSLNENTTGVQNTGVGDGALQHNVTGDQNTAVGSRALLNDTAFADTALGVSALELNTTGFWNTAVGIDALFSNTTGHGNTAVGLGAGRGEILGNANTTGSDNTFLGMNAGPGTSTELNNATAIGANALVSASNALVLGASGVNAGVGTATPRSLLQLGKPSASYGDYLQLPTVSSGSPPPAGACNASTFVGRLVLQYDAAKSRTTLWNCSAAGVWTTLAKD